MNQRKHVMETESNAGFNKEEHGKHKSDRYTSFKTRVFSYNAVIFEKYHKIIKTLKSNRIFTTMTDTVFLYLRLTGNYS